MKKNKKTIKKDKELIDEITLLINSKKDQEIIQHYESNQEQWHGIFAKCTLEKHISIGSIIFNIYFNGNTREKERELMEALFKNELFLKEYKMVYTLANMYYNGLGGNVNDVGARKYLELLEKAGQLEKQTFDKNNNARNFLAKMYQFGIGGNVDKKKALLLYQKLYNAQKLLPTSLFNFVLLLTEQSDTASLKNAVTILEYLHKQNKLSDEELLFLIEMYLFNKGCSDKQKEARILLEYLENKKYQIPPQFQLVWAFLCFDGSGGNVDIEKAFNLFKSLEKTGYLDTDENKCHRGLCGLLESYLFLNGTQLENLDLDFTIKLSEKLLGQKKIHLNDDFLFLSLPRVMKNLIIFHLLKKDIKKSQEQSKKNIDFVNKMTGLKKNGDCSHLFSLAILSARLLDSHEDIVKYSFNLIEKNSTLFFTESAVFYALINSLMELKNDNYIDAFIEKIESDKDSLPTTDDITKKLLILDELKNLTEKNKKIKNEKIENIELTSNKINNLSLNSSDAIQKPNVHTETKEKIYSSFDADTENKSTQRLKIFKTKIDTKYTKHTKYKKLFLFEEKKKEKNDHPKIDITIKGKIPMLVTGGLLPKEGGTILSYINYKNENIIRLMDKQSEAFSKAEEIADKAEMVKSGSGNPGLKKLTNNGLWEIKIKGEYEEFRLMGLPLKLKDKNGAPCTVIEWFEGGNKNYIENKYYNLPREKAKKDILDRSSELQKEIDEFNLKSQKKI